MKKIKKGDDVVVITGRDLGRRGAVTRVTEDDRVYVEGVNMVKQHVRPNPQVGEPGGIKQVEASIHVSNVAIWNSMTEKADRVGFKMLEDGTKIRVFKSNGEAVDV